MTVKRALPTSRRRWTKLYIKVEFLIIFVDSVAFRGNTIIFEFKLGMESHFSFLNKPVAVVNQGNRSLEQKGKRSKALVEQCYSFFSL